MKRKYFPTTRKRQPIGRSAFTLIEVLVALGIMMLLLVIILVPINMALNLFHIGKARNDVQLASKQIINQITADLRKAIFVYPNEQFPGITNKSPYSNNTFQPYFQIGTSTPVSNTSRLDMLLPATSNGNTVTPTQASNYIVSYYGRRFTYNDVTADYDPFTNPVVLWRAQYAFKNDNGSALATTNSANTRYGTPWPTDTPYFSGRLWLMQNQWEEPNLEPISAYSADTTSSSHLQISPRDMALVAPNASATPTPSYKPTTSFTCDDTNSDGKIDRVTVSMLLRKYDDIGADAQNGQPRGQELRLTQVIDLPNVK